MKRETVKAMAITMVTDAGLINLSRSELCERAGIPDGSFPHVMGCNFADFVEELKLENIETGNHVAVKSRANPTLRKDHILNIATEMAKSGGYNKITRDAIAHEAGVSMGLVTRYFGTMQQLRRCIMRKAVRDGIVEIIAQGLANRDEHAKKASVELQQSAVQFLIN